jgi:CRP-like cAMP-binding protein
MRQLAPYLLPVELPADFTLHAPGQHVDTVYFPETGICSIVAAMEDGTTIEVGISGRDGFVGAAAVLDADQSPNRCFVAIPGHGFRVKSKILIEHAEASPSIRKCLLRSVQAQMVQTAQTAACNRVHDLHERLARWLLMCRDRVQSDRIFVTHELLATMLGTRRSSVSVAAGILEKAGLISHTRGHVMIENSSGLLDAACECYSVVHNEFVRLGLL